MAKDDGGMKILPTKHKIDAYGSFMLLIHIYILLLVLSTLSSFHLMVLAPNEMLLQGPILLNSSDTDPTENQLICNPFYQNFRENYITDELKSFESVKSGEFINRTDVQELLKATNEATNSDSTFLGIKLTGICEIIRPANKMGSCISFSRLEKECLGGECGTDPNVCFWRSASLMNLLALLHVLTFIASVLLTMGLMYDPPPARLGLFLKPVFATVFYALTGAFAILGNLMAGIGKSKYAPDIMAETFPGFEVLTGPGNSAFQVVGVVNMVCAGIFLYLTIFAPKYPRMKKRWDLRRQNLKKGLEQIRVEQGQ